MRSSGQTNAFQSYNQTFTSFLTWELAIVPVGTGDQRICISLPQPRRPNKKSKATWHRKTVSHPLSKQNSLSVLLLDLYLLSCLVTSSCPSGDWDRELMNLHFSLQLSRPTEKFQGNMTQKTILYPVSESYKIQIWSYFTFTSFLTTDLAFLAMGGWARGSSTVTYLKVHKH